jgi:hypothetical protein
MLQEQKKGTVAREEDSDESSLRDLDLSTNRVHFFLRLFHGWTTTAAFSVMRTLELQILIPFCLRMVDHRCRQLVSNILSVHSECAT